MPFSKKKLFLRILIGVSVLFAGVAAILYVRLSDMETVKGMVIAELERMAGRPVTLESVEVDFEEEGLGLRLNQLTLLQGATPGIEVAADSVWIGFRIIPFLSNQVSIRSIEIVGADIHWVRDKAGRLPFLETAKAGGTATGGRLADLFWTGMIRSINVEDSTLRWTDHTVATAEGAPATFVLHHVGLSLSRPLLAAKVMLRLEADWASRQLPEPDLTLVAEVQFARGMEDLQAVHYEGELHARDVASEMVRPYWKQVLDFDPQPALLRVRSSFSGTWGTILETSGRVEHRFAPADHTASLLATDHPAAGGLHYDLVWTPGALEVRRADYMAGDYQFQVKGALTPFPSPDPGAALQVRTTALTPEDLKNTFPFNLLPDETRASLRSYWRSGRVQVESAAFRGTWNELTRWSSTGLQAEDLPVEDLSSAGPPTAGLLTASPLGALTATLQLDNIESGDALPGLDRLTGSVHYRDGGITGTFEQARFYGVLLRPVQATVKDLFTEPWLESRFELRAGIEDLLPVIKARVSAPTVRERLQAIQKMSGETASHVDIAGPLARPDRWRVQGETTIQNGALQTTDLRSAFQNIAGTVAFVRAAASDTVEPGVSLTFTGFSAECRNHRFHDFAGTTRIDSGNVQTQVTGAVDLGALQSKQFIPPGAVAGRFGKILKDLEVSDGILNVELRDERFADTKKPAVMEGRVQFKNVSVQYRNRFRPLRRVTGEVTFGSGKIAFATREAHYGDSPLTIQGTFFHPGKPKAELVLKATATDFKQQDFTGIPFLETLDYRGMVQVESVLHWTQQAVTLKNSVDLTRAAYTFRDLVVKPEKVPNTLEMVMTFSEKDGIDFKQLAMALGGNTVSGTGRVTGAEPPHFQFKLGASRFKVASVSPYIKPLRAVRGGTLDFEISGKGRVDTPQDADYEGHVRLKEVRFTPEHLAAPVRVRADMFFANRVVKVRKGQVVIGKTPLTVEGKVIATDRPQWDLKIAADSLDLALLGGEPGKIKAQGKKLPAGNTGKATAPVEAMGWMASPWFTTGTGSLDLRLGALTVSRARFESVQGQLQFKEGIVFTDNLQWGRPGRDRFDVQATLKVEAHKPPHWSAHVVSAGTQVKGFFDLFGTLFDDCLTGDLERLEARVQAEGQTLKELTRTLDGTLALRIRQGRIQTGRLLNGTIGMFGYELDPQRAAERKRREFADYKTIKGDFSLQGGVAFTENFIFENPKQLMTLVGSFDLNAHSMDTVVGVAPWRVVDSFFKNIPLVGKILTAGDEESVFKNYYKVKGPFADPGVTTIPFTSLEKKVVGMFQAILNTPQYLFSRGKEPAGQN